MVPILALVIAVVAAGLVCGVACFFLGVQHRKRIAEALIGTAEKEANRLKSDAMNEIESRKKEMRIEAKEEAQKIRAEADKEIRERRNDIQRQEKRIQQKEENLDKKVENLEAKEERNAKKEKQIEEKLAEVEQMKKGQLDLLEKISGFTAEQAKEEMLKALNDELDHEKAVRILAFKERTQEESDKIAKEIISRAIQRCAAENTGDATISVVSLPNDEMKGRIIGREGRNIRSFETVTGADLIIDDTPEAITVSCFDPVRREIARLALQSLVTDGRIHPAKIEETVEKTKREVNKTIKAKGERAVIDAGIRSINPDLVKLIGKLYYRTSFGQNVLNHSLEVCYLSGIMAAELGENVELAKRAGLLHDIGKGVDHEQEGTHIQLGVEIAKKYRENNDVIHAIEAHHGDVETKTVIASIVQAADAISAARPGARREQIENYIKRLEKLEEIAKSFEGVESSYAIQAGRELRILVKPDEIDEDKMTILAREIANKIESDMEYPGQIKVNVIRENRAVEYAT